MPIRLVPIADGKSIKLDKPVVLIGRNPDCDVILTRNRKVSRAHCIIACIENSVFVRDLGSTNGVWLNGQRVERESSVRIGDELSIADVRYQLLNVEREIRGSSPEIPVAESEPKRDRSERDRGERDRGERERSERDQHKERDRSVPRELSTSERLQKEHERRLRHSGLKPIDISQNIPVPIPDEDDSFVVEASMPRLPKPAALAKLEEAARLKESSQPARRRRNPDDSSCDVIPLANQSPPTDDAIPVADFDDADPLAGPRVLSDLADSDASIPLVAPDDSEADN